MMDITFIQNFLNFVGKIGWLYLSFFSEYML